MINNTIIYKQYEVSDHIDKLNESYTDICFHPRYAELYEKKEDGKIETFSFKNENGSVEHTYLKRKIPYLIDEEQYFDITTAYGYGGPIVREAVNLKELLNNYFAAFDQYCKNNRIISEFIRFHLFENNEVRENYYGKVALIGPHIARDLKKPLDANIHKSVRTSVRKAIKKGITFTTDTTEQGLTDFLTVYNSTMNRHEAEEFYYFDKDFFGKLQNELDGHYVYTKAVLDGKTISSYLILYGKTYAFGFLGGTLEEYFDYEPATFLEYQTIKWLKEKGKDYYIIGGGYKGEDGLYRYKRKFDKEGVHPFYVGKKIHNPEVYDSLVEMRSIEKGFDKDALFFPLYRQ